MSFSFPYDSKQKFDVPSLFLRYKSFSPPFWNYRIMGVTSDLHRSYLGGTAEKKKPKC